MNFVVRSVAAFGLAAAMMVPAGFAAAEEEAAMDSGWGFHPYIGAGAGLSLSDESATSGITTVNIDDDVLSWGILAGAKFGDYVAIEAFYKDFGDHDITGNIGGVPFTAGDIGFDAFGTSVLVSLPLGDMFSVYAKTGVHFWDAEASLIGFDADGTDWHIGGGLDVALSDNFVIRSEYGYYEFDNFDLQELTAALVFVF